MSGVGLTASIGSLTVHHSEAVSISGFNLTGSLGSLTNLNKTNILVIGLEGSSFVSNLLVWSTVDDDQNPNFNEITSTQTSDFSEVTDTQSPNWNEATSTQTSNFNQVTETQNPNWDDVGYLKNKKITIYMIIFIKKISEVKNGKYIR